MPSIRISPLQLQSICTGVSIVSNLLLVRAISPSTYASLAYVGVAATAIVALSPSGAEVYALRNILSWTGLEGEKQKQQLLNDAVVLRIVIAMLMGSVAWLYIHYTAINSGARASLGFTATVIMGAIAGSVLDTLGIMRKAYGDYTTGIAITQGTGVLSRLMMLCFATIDNAAVINAAGVTVICAGLCYHLAQNRQLLRVLTPGLRWRDLLQRHRTFRSFACTSYLSFCVGHLDHLICSFLVAPSIFATFTLVRSIAGAGQMAVGAWLDPMTQQYVAHRYDTGQMMEVRRKVERSVMRAIWILLILAVPLALLLPAAVGWLGFGKYEYIATGAFMMYLHGCTIILGRPTRNLIDLMLPVRGVIGLQVLRFVVYATTCFVFAGMQTDIFLCYMLVAELTVVLSEWGIARLYWRV